MSDSFGARLRRHREQQHVLLAAIAEETKIKLSLLEALEEDDVSHWPSGIFRRAYVRAYAHAIGLPPEEVLREFLDRHPEPPEFLEAASDAATGRESVSAGPPTRLRHIVGAAFGSLQSRLRRAPEGTVNVGTRVEQLPVPAQCASELPSETWDSEVEQIGTATGVPDVPPSEASAVDAAPSESGDERSEEESKRSAPEGDFGAIATFCTLLGQAQDACELQPLLGEVARVLEATGLIVWIWDGSARVLRPVLTHGYSDRVLAHLSPVEPDAENATAAAFRLAETKTIRDAQGTCDALVVPLLGPGGCAGVLALELQRSRQQVEWTRAAATIVAALLAQLIGARQEQASAPQVEAHASLIGDAAMPVLRVRADGRSRVPRRLASAGRRDGRMLATD